MNGAVVKKIRRETNARMQGMEQGMRVAVASNFVKHVNSMPLLKRVGFAMRIIARKL